MMTDKNTCFSISPSGLTSEIRNNTKKFKTHYKSNINKISKNKIIVTNHALERFNTRVETNKTWVSKKQLQEIAYNAKYKGIHLNSKDQILYHFKNEPEICEYLITCRHYCDNNSDDIIYYNNYVWIFGGHHDRTLITVYLLDPNFLDFDEILSLRNLRNTRIR